MTDSHETSSDFLIHAEALINTLNGIVSSNFFDEISNSLSQCRIDQLLLCSGIQSFLNKCDKIHCRDPVASWKTLKTYIFKLFLSNFIIEDPIYIQGNFIVKGDKFFDISVQDDMIYILKKIKKEEEEEETIEPSLSLSTSQTELLSTKSIKAVILRACDLVQQKNCNINDITEQISLEFLNNSTESGKIPYFSLYSSMSNAFNQPCTLAASAPLYSPNGVAVKFRAKRWGPKIFVPINLDHNTQKIKPLNTLASWLTGSLIHGDVIIMDLNIGRLEDFLLSDLVSIVKSTFPSQLWSWYPIKGFQSQYRLPYKYNPFAWIGEGNYLMKKPVILLNEFVSRRTGGIMPQFTKQVCRIIIPEPSKPSSLAMKTTATVVNELSSPEEAVPLGWWTEATTTINDSSTLDGKLLSKLPIAASTAGTSTASSSNVIYCVKCTLILPNLNNSLLQASGATFHAIYPRSTSEPPASMDDISIATIPAEEVLNNELPMFETLDYAEQSLALQALWLIQHSSEAFLFGAAAAAAADNSYNSNNSNACESHSSVEFTLKISPPMSASTVIAFHGLTGVGMFPPKIEELITSALPQDFLSYLEDSEPSDDDITAPTTAAYSAPITFQVSNIQDFLQADLLEKIHIFCDLNPNSSIKGIDPIEESHCTSAVIDIDITSHCLCRPVSQCNSSSPKLFFPALSDQRKNLVAMVLRSTGASNWLDMGCGEGAYLSACLKVHGQMSTQRLTKIGGLDITAKLNTAKKLIENAIAARSLEIQHLSLSSEVLSQVLEEVYLWSASMLDPNICRAIAKMGFTDVVSCMEVIEHLPSIEHAEIGMYNMLACISPQVLIVSTPNYEANIVLQRTSNISVLTALKNSLSPAKTDTVVVVEENGRQGNATCTRASSSEPNPASFRESDHKFEFTRREFRVWIEDILARVRLDVQVEYEVSMVELGSRLEGMEDTGGATQCAVIRKIVGDRDRTVLDILTSEELVDLNEVCLWHWKR